MKPTIHGVFGVAGSEAEVSVGPVNQSPLSDLQPSAIESKGEPTPIETPVEPADAGNDEAADENAFILETET